MFGIRQLSRARVQIVSDSGVNATARRRELFDRCQREAALDQAEAQSRILLTLDHDFWQLAIQRREPLVRSGVILLRVKPAVPANLTPVTRRAFSVEREWTGYVSIITIDEIRMIPVRAGV